MALNEVGTERSFGYSEPDYFST